MRAAVLVGLIASIQSLLTWADSYADQELRARGLLERAVAQYQQEGERSFAAFSRLGPFTEDDLYVFVVNRQGVMMASGGPSRVLIGRNITPLLDDQLRTGFQSILQTPLEQGVQEGEYRWINWRLGRVERKKAFYQPMNGHILAVGYYLPRADKASAVNMLERVVRALETDPEQTIALINQLDSEFYQDDIYPVVVDNETRRFLAHGYNHGLVGTRFETVKDHAGSDLGAPVVALMQNRDEGEFSYQWRNPVTQKVEAKTAAIRRVGRYLVLVGWYNE
ncbi:cache domain-containing protein [Halopseudomonas phragmitis]|uniref:Double Cache domain-containing protein n=1 Tax=Halopseudomonas phragmitis TaxID=1931241 RepID=A0A1V0B985_9GAMM|nr:cache domain-containing protein [Halopseudomonas phragmitis]AQZ96450.1 hypothetical protein BVH74_17565 [Halopseudomonas phragmitis]